jgi:isocitrate dehydrogenase
MFLENEGKVTIEMSALGDEIKKVIRSILKAQEAEAYKNSKDLEIHLYAG